MATRVKQVRLNGAAQIGSDLEICIFTMTSRYCPLNSEQGTPIFRTRLGFDPFKKGYVKGIDPFHSDNFHWQMGWALWEKNDCEAALVSMRKMSNIPKGAYRMLARIYACLGKEREAKEALAVVLKDSPGQSIRQERKQWEKIWTAPGSLDRWIKDMRLAGLPE